MGGGGPSAEPAGKSARPPSRTPSQTWLQQDLVGALLEPPDAAVARDLVRDIGRRLKKPVSPLLIADALRHLSPSHRGSKPRDRSFVQNALLQRLQKEAEWIGLPLVEPRPTEVQVGADELPNGSWTWRYRDLAVLSADQGRTAVLHLTLQNQLETVDVGQPVAIVLADEVSIYGWSPVASAQLASGSCPDGCQGSLASVAVEPNAAFLGHLVFHLPTEATPTYWGLEYGEELELRPCTPASPSSGT
jgi:hypothetical protein